VKKGRGQGSRHDLGRGQPSLQVADGIEATRIVTKFILKLIGEGGI
jgi:hypothetical protein